jgi:hypothetical protein
MLQTPHISIPQTVEYSTEIANTDAHINSVFPTVSSRNEQDEIEIIIQSLTGIG